MKKCFIKSRKHAAQKQIYAKKVGSKFNQYLHIDLYVYWLYAKHES